MTRLSRKGIRRPGSILIAIIILTILGGIATAIALKSPGPKNGRVTATQRFEATEDQHWKEKAHTLFSKGEVKAALPIMEKYLTDHPGDVAVREEYAQTLWLIGKQKSALKEFERVAISQPPNASLYYKIGLLLRQIDDENRSLAYLRKAVTVDPDTAVFHVELAKAYSAKKKYDLAVGSWNSAIEASRGSNSRASLYAELGNTHLLAGATDEAIAAFQSGLRIDPNNSYLLKLKSESER